MNNYKYKVRDKLGALVTGVIGGENENDVNGKLRRMGYTPISINLSVERQAIVNLVKKINRVSATELILFTRQMSTLVKAGVAIVAALEACKEQTNNEVLKKILGSIITDVEGGSSFSSALSRHPECFDELYVNMMRSGEAAGILETVLDRIADLGEYQEEIKAKIKTATRYPLLVVVALAVGFTIVVTFVIPRFASMFSQFKTQLPFPTRVMIGLNYTIKHYWYLIIMAAGGTIYGFFSYIKTSSGRAIWDRVKIKIPIFGPLIVKSAMSRFARVTSILTKSGLPILQVLELTAKTVGNTVISSAIDTIRTSVNEGKGMTEPMKANKLFPPIVVQMVAVGEETGKLDELLFKVSEYYDKQVDYTIKNLGILIEPILLLVLGCGVLFMALAIFLPMWDMMSLFRH